jgi:hypothetical protein
MPEAKDEHRIKNRGSTKFEVNSRFFKRTKIELSDANQAYFEIRY